jgi:hypothetical protein
MKFFSMKIFSFQ